MIPSRRHALGGLLACACLIGAGALPLAAQDIQVAARAQPAVELVRSLADRALSALQDESLSSDDLANVFAELLQQGFDIDYIGAFALGQNWRGATDQQRADYLAVFSDLIVSVYTERLMDYGGQTVRIAGADVIAERANYSDIIVHMLLDQPNGAPVRIDWRVRDRGDRRAIIDVVIADVSMSMTQRSEFAALIDRNGGSVDALIASLRNRVN